MAASQSPRTCSITHCLNMMSSGQTPCLLFSLRRNWLKFILETELRNVIEIVNSIFGVDFPFNSNFSPNRCLQILSFSPRSFSSSQIHQSHYFTIFDGSDMLVKLILQENHQIMALSVHQLLHLTHLMFSCAFHSFTARMILYQPALVLLLSL